MRIVYSILSMFFSSWLFATTINNVVVFGDSLSDSGNLYAYMDKQVPQSPPYFEGRFTNGPVWIELLMKAYYPEQDVKMHLSNFAFGGAGVSEVEDGPLFTLRGEVDAYLLGHNNKASPNSLYVVWIGANNYLGVPEDKDKAVAEVITGMRHDLTRIINAGAKHVLLVNVPDLSLTPFAIEADLQAEMKMYSIKHNIALLELKNEFETAYPLVNFVLLDVNEVIGDIFEHPERHGFTDVKSTCYEESVAAQNSPNNVLAMVASVKAGHGDSACDGHLFFDPVHPAKGAHALMAKKAKSVLDAAGYEFVN